ncbi:hypothetical protein N7466_008427 [Penicillium verhagenii]|uniref:uncharacterized protein n=1 Tax=Penicillium verhagenii TaxID=1562060 RepID=UPI0025454471|nr:uncharacterized protein N7466_008427 [Penicillium verhagenii]KAJ5924240.1 hypothetical protein N7466_008427 [Penicillium verhagenii]
MATQPPQQDTSSQRREDFEKFKKYTAYTFLVASPVLIALPPRKLDHLTVLLVGAFAFSANHVTREQTGRSIVDRIESRIARPRMKTSDLPSERAQEVQMRLRAAREAQLREGGMPADEIEKWKALQAKQDQNIAQRVWLGGEKEGWMERRIQEEQKALEEGKGYGDLISEYVWDVWSWGKNEEEDDD